jgi:hypothetical protein
MGRELRVRIGFQEVGFVRCGRALSLIDAS